MLTAISKAITNIANGIQTVDVPCLITGLNADANAIVTVRDGTAMSSPIVFCIVSELTNQTKYFEQFTYPLKISNALHANVSGGNVILYRA